MLYPTYGNDVHAPSHRSIHGNHTIFTMTVWEFTTITRASYLPASSSGWQYVHREQFIGGRDAHWLHALLSALPAPAYRWHNDSVWLGTDAHHQYDAVQCAGDNGVLRAQQRFK